MAKELRVSGLAAPRPGILGLAPKTYSHVCVHACTHMHEQSWMHLCPLLGTSFLFSFPHICFAKDVTVPWWAGGASLIQGLLRQHVCVGPWLKAAMVANKRRNPTTVSSRRQSSGIQADL